MLHFIYRDALVGDDELLSSCSSSTPALSGTVAAKLLAVADKYDLTRLRLLCESFFCKHISVSSVADILSLADDHHAADLKSICLKFAAENLMGKVYFFFRLFPFCLQKFCLSGQNCCLELSYPSEFGPWNFGIYFLQ